MEMLKVIAAYAAFGVIVVLVVAAITLGGAGLGKLTFSPSLMP